MYVNSCCGVPSCHEFLTPRGENPPNVITHLFFKRSNVSLLLILKDVVGLKLFLSGGGGGGGDGGDGGGGGGWDVCLSFMRSRLLTSYNLFG